MSDGIDWNEIEEDPGVSTLDRISEFLDGSSPEELSVWIMELFKKAVEADTCVLAIEREGRLVPMVTVGDVEAGREKAVPVENSLPGLITGGGIGTVPSIGDLRAGYATLARDESWRNGAQGSRHRSVIWVPLGNEGIIFGLNRQQNAYDREDLDIAKDIGQNISAVSDRETLFGGAATEDRNDQVADIISHDLRNKIGIVRGRLELAQRDGDLEQLEDISLALDSLESIVDMVVTIARSGEPIDSLEAVRLDKAAETVMEALSEPNATLSVRASATIMADRGCLEQILDNVFRNAVDHSPGPVLIEVGLLESGFYVADDGPGISEKHREDVLNPGVSTAEDHQGTGLTIVERLASAHGWTVELTESLGEGTRVEFTGVAFCRPG